MIEFLDYSKGLFGTKMSIKRTVKLLPFFSLFFENWKIILDTNLYTIEKAVLNMPGSTLSLVMTPLACKIRPSLKMYGRGMYKSDQIDISYYIIYTYVGYKI